MLLQELKRVHPEDPAPGNGDGVVKALFHSGLEGAVRDEGLAPDALGSATGAQGQRLPVPLQQQADSASPQKGAAGSGRYGTEQQQQGRVPVPPLGSVVDDDDVVLMLDDEDNEGDMEGGGAGAGAAPGASRRRPPHSPSPPPRVVYISDDEEDDDEDGTGGGSDDEDDEEWMPGHTPLYRGAVAALPAGQRRRKGSGTGAPPLPVQAAAARALAASADSSCSGSGLPPGGSRASSASQRRGSPTVEGQLSDKERRRVWERPVLDSVNKCRAGQGEGPVDKLTVKLLKEHLAGKTVMGKLYKPGARSKDQLICDYRAYLGLQQDEANIKVKLENLSGSATLHSDSAPSTAAASPRDDLDVSNNVSTRAGPQRRGPLVPPLDLSASIPDHVWTSTSSDGAGLAGERGSMSARSSVIGGRAPGESYRSALLSASTSPRPCASPRIGARGSRDGSSSGRVGGGSLNLASMKLQEPLQGMAAGSMLFVQKSHEVRARADQQLRSSSGSAARGSLRDSWNVLRGDSNGSVDEPVARCVIPSNLTSSLDSGAGLGLSLSMDLKAPAIKKEKQRWK